MTTFFSYSLVLIGNLCLFNMVIYKNMITMNIINIILIILGFLHRVHGLDNYKLKGGAIIYTFVFTIITTLVVMYLYAHLKSIERDQYTKLIEMMAASQFKKQTSDEMNEIFENLEEGIVIFKEKQINFTNSNFIEILKSINVIPEDFV